METYNYIFWHNPYNNLWHAIPRNEYLTFFNGNKHKIEGLIATNQDINVLVDYINGKTQELI